jgi:hypothetical protein
MLAVCGEGELAIQDAQRYLPWVFHPSLSRRWMARSNSAGSLTTSVSDKSSASFMSVYLLLMRIGRPRKVDIAF